MDAVLYRNFPTWAYPSFNRKECYSFDRNNFIIFPCFIWFYLIYINMEEKEMETKDKIITALLIVIFFLFTATIMALTYSGVHTFYIGFHNVDIAWNFKQVESSLDIVLIDTASDGNLYTMKEIYTMGLDGLRESIIYFGLAIIFSLVWGFLLKIIIQRK